MDKKKALLNVGVSIVFKVLVLVANILSRRFLIQYIGEEILGLNDLYLSIINVLSVAELGIGTAISFSMYRPIVEGDNAKVAALYRLYTKLYLIVGGIILVGGCAVMPALPYLAKGRIRARASTPISAATRLRHGALSWLLRNRAARSSSVLIPSPRLQISSMSWPNARISA